VAEGGRGYARPLDLRHGRIDMNHGAGGRLTGQLVSDIFLPAFDNPYLRQGDDGARLPMPHGGELVMTTDAHVVSPVFFPGGDIGSLAVHGTINDLAMMGAVPLYLSVSMVLEEGFLLADLVRVAASMGQAARASRVAIVCGDTKVVERGKGDGIFLSTCGLGLVPSGCHIGGAGARCGDRIVVSGTIGDHGIAILSLRESLEFETTLCSDTAALDGLVGVMLSAVPPGAIHVLRDPTRGGLATTLNEIASQSNQGMLLQEVDIPIVPQVEAACEMLGLDPLYVANEGKLVAVVSGDAAERLVLAMQAHPLGRRAACIGSVVSDPNCFVQMATRVGGSRVVDWLSGEPLPRIC
jgi:hydrogenase expression/formation protein HypE